MSLLPIIPPETAAWWYYLCVGGSVLIMAISKSGFGGGTGILAVPLMALVMPSGQMLGVMLIVLIACDVPANLHYVREYAWHILIPLFGGGLVGVVAGTAILWTMRDTAPQQLQQTLSLIIGSICLVVVALQVYRLTGRHMVTLPMHPASSMAIGLAASTVSTIAHGAGPILSVYLLEAKLPKRKFVGTTLLYTLIMNPLKMPTYLALGFVDSQTWRSCIWWLPLVLIGTFLGAKLNHKVPQRPFAAIMYTAAAITSVMMIYKSVF